MTNIQLASIIIDKIKNGASLYEIRDLLDENSHHAHNCNKALAGDNYDAVQCTCGADDS